MKRAVFIVFLCIPLFAGCDLLVHMHSVKYGIEFSTLAQGSHVIQDNDFDRKAPELELFNSLEEVQLYLENKMGGERLLDTLKTIDFNRYSVILLHLEMQSTGSIQTKIESVTKEEGTIHVNAARILPSGFVTTDIGFPCHVIKTSKIKGEIHLAALRDITRNYTVP